MGKNWHGKPGFGWYNIAGNPAVWIYSRSSFKY